VNERAGVKGKCWVSSWFARGHWKFFPMAWTI